MPAHDRAMNGERRGLGFIIWTLVWAVIGGFLLLLAAAANDCDTSANKFCSLGVFLYGALAVGAGLIWLVGMGIGAVVASRSGPSDAPRLTCPGCNASNRQDAHSCGNCGQRLGGGT